MANLGHLPSGTGHTDHLPAKAGVQARRQAWLDTQDAGPPLTPAERQATAGLVALAELRSLLHPRARRPRFLALRTPGLERRAPAQPGEAGIVPVG
jgi:hypothetical protein